MPRKQRFKPSRKPQNAPQPVRPSAEDNEIRREGHAEDVEVENNPHIRGAALGADQSALGTEREDSG
jgi:hypothetical protein